MRAPTEESLKIEAHGAQLDATLWLGEHASERSVVFLPGIGAPRRYLRALALELASRGFGVLTFDYRGVGGSLHEPDFRRIVADDWIDRDIPAAVEKLSALTRPRFLGVFAHSLGGQLLGQSPAVDAIDGALFLACQRGIPRLFGGAARVRVEYAYRSFPLLARIFGEIPVSAMTFPARTPPGAVLQWIRWGRDGRFRRADGTDTEPRFGCFRGPLLSLRIEDDEAYAPRAAVEALERLYTGACLQTEVLRPGDFGQEALGHFGAFSPRAPRALWARLHEGLLSLESRARRLREPEGPQTPGLSPEGAGLCHANPSH